ncbi:MAG: hypothetical protein IJR48_07970 [Oscillibacter sp.]|nr:hypothetical protein [Oscillibacter sp.]MBQ9618286.1 hypothetical protein [Oscillibacter sp.]
MDTPRYVLSALDATAVTKANMGAVVRVKIAVWILLGVMLLLSLLTGENVFRGLSWPAKLSVIVLTLWALCFNTDELAPAPMELRFYDDRLVVYHDRRAYSPRNVRREIRTIYYRDVKECQYRKRRARVNIVGRFEDTWYTFPPDGPPPAQASRQRVVDGAITFHTYFSPEIDFAAEIEAHSPLRVTVTE